MARAQMTTPCTKRHFSCPLVAPCASHRKHRYIIYAAADLPSADPSFWLVRELGDIRRGEGPDLTATESAVLRLLVAGKTYKKVASERTCP
jgi:DNA-binding NarL/FixJ family response regulator